MAYRLTRERGASITGAVMRISTLVPVAFSLLAWGERALGVAGRRGRRSRSPRCPC